MIHERKCPLRRQYQHSGGFFIKKTKNTSSDADADTVFSLDLTQQHLILSFILQSVFHLLKLS